MAQGNERIRILVVDDSPDTLEVLHRNLTAEGYTALTAPGAVEEGRTLEGTPVDLVITDLKMPRVSGLDLVKHVRENYPDTEVMVITGYATVESAVESVRAGAEDYLAKPFTDEELLDAVRRALRKLEQRRAANGVPTEEAQAAHGIWGGSRAMQPVLRDIPKAAASTATVLITGESGTGKELVARAIHYSGPRASAPFMPVNCGGIPEGLLESTLFGHLKGAFTGATTSRAGLFHAADTGTIFLDEIGDTSPAMQAKLLRTLQDGEVRMVGSDRAQKVDVRIVAATNRDLGDLVRRGKFREDLYFRLNVVAIDLPPLRARGDDLFLLIRRFAAKYAAEQGRERPRFSGEALRVLAAYHWPGNVRELQNVIQRLLVMAEGDAVEVSDLPSLMRFSPLGEERLDRPLVEVEADYIRKVLESVGGNRSRAAQTLGIDRKTLRRKLGARREGAN